MKAIHQQYGWDSIPLRYVCQLNPSVDFTGLEDSDLTFLPMDRVKSGYFIPNTDKFTKYAASYNAFEEGDIILAKVTPCFENGNIAIAENLANGKGFGSSELFVVRPTKINQKFLFYYFQSLTFKQEGEASMTGAGGLKRVDPGLLRQHHVPYPGEDTQCLIADYLDRETARIDALVAEKEKMLALLEEKRAALISRAVTRGLNPDAPMKPSGLDWLEEIPEHWEIRRLKHLTQEPLAYGANEAALEDNLDWPRFVRITDINEEGMLRSETFRSLLPEIAEPYLLEEGDILFARSGATVGKTFIYRPEWGKACFAGYLIRFRSAQELVLPDFIYYFSLSDIYWQQVESGTIQATIQNFSAEKYAALVVCLPPLSEQMSIVDFLNVVNSRISILLEGIRNSISLLKERRAALITAAVTGQIPLEEMRR